MLGHTAIFSISRWIVRKGQFKSLTHSDATILSINVIRLVSNISTVYNNSQFPTQSLSYGKLSDALQTITLLTIPLRLRWCCFKLYRHT